MITAWQIFPTSPTRKPCEVQGRIWTSDAGIDWFIINGRTTAGRVQRYRIGVSVFLTEAMANKARIGRCARKLTSANSYSHFKGYTNVESLKRVVGNTKVYKDQL